VGWILTEDNAEQGVVCDLFIPVVKQMKVRLNSFRI